MSTAHTYLRNPLVWLLIPAMLVGAVAISSGTAQAEEGAGDACVIRGTGAIEKGIQIYSAKEAGVAIAGFASQPVTVELSDIPADAAGRSKIKTGTGSGGVRIEGYIEVSKVPLSAKVDVPVATDHVWIAQGERLKFTGSLPGKIGVELAITATSQKLKAKAICAKIAVGRAPASDVEPPKGTRRFVLKNKTLDLFDEANGTSIFTVEVPIAESGILLFGAADKAGYIRVEHRGQMVIDGWAKASDLKVFPKGEMLDALGGGTWVSTAPAKLKVEGATKEVKVLKDVSIRLSANDAVKPIGVLESGAEAIVIDIIAGWARIYPKTLNILPPEGKDFWVKAAELGP